MKPYDILIIGQGLIGSLLAFTLIKKGQNVLVLDDGHQSSSSKIAAGMINPIAGFRPNPMQHFNKKLSHAKKLYQEIERDLSFSFFHQRVQKRIFTSTKQRETWQSALDSLRIYDQNLQGLDSAYGWAHIKDSYQVQIPLFLSKIQTYLQDNQSYQIKSVDWSTLQESKDHLVLEGIKAKRIISCEGWKIVDNEHFQYLDMCPAKGEILTLKIPELSEEIYNWGKWLVPVSKNTFLMGSTFEWEKLNQKPTESIQKALLDLLYKQLRDASYSVVDHRAGVRPATSSRNPYVERHPDIKALYCCNGFGSHGCIKGPIYIENLCQELINNTPMHLDL